MIYFGNSTSNNILNLDVSNSCVGINIDNPRVTLDISGTDGVILPRGISGERPYGRSGGKQKYRGGIRYNTTYNSFEVYSREPATSVGAYTNDWRSFSKIIDKDNDTKIVPSSTDISFSTNDEVRMVIDEDGKVGIGTTTPSYICDVSGSINSTYFNVNGIYLIPGHGEGESYFINQTDGQSEYTDLSTNQISIIQVTNTCDISGNVRGKDGVTFLGDLTIGVSYEYHIMDISGDMYVTSDISIETECLTISADSINMPYNTVAPESYGSMRVNYEEGDADIPSDPFQYYTKDWNSLGSKNAFMTFQTDASTNNWDASYAAYIYGCQIQDCPGEYGPIQLDNTENIEHFGDDWTRYYCYGQRVAQSDINENFTCIDFIKWGLDELYESTVPESYGIYEDGGWKPMVCFQLHVLNADTTNDRWMTFYPKQSLMGGHTWWGDVGLQDMTYIERYTLTSGSYLNDPVDYESWYEYHARGDYIQYCIFFLTGAHGFMATDDWTRGDLDPVDLSNAMYSGALSGGQLIHPQIPRWVYMDDHVSFDITDPPEENIGDGCGNYMDLPEGYGTGLGTVTAWRPNLPLSGTPHRNILRLFPNTDSTTALERLPKSSAGFGYKITSNDHSLFGYTEEGGEGITISKQGIYSAIISVDFSGSLATDYTARFAIFKDTSSNDISGLVPYSSVVDETNIEFYQRVTTDLDADSSQVLLLHEDIDIYSNYFGRSITPVPWTDISVITLPFFNSEDDGQYRAQYITQFTLNKPSSLIIFGSENCDTGDIDITDDIISAGKFFQLKITRLGDTGIITKYDYSDISLNNVVVANGFSNFNVYSNDPFWYEYLWETNTNGTITTFGTIYINDFDINVDMVLNAHNAHPTDIPDRKLETSWAYTLIKGNTYTITVGGAYEGVTFTSDAGDINLSVDGQVPANDDAYDSNVNGYFKVVFAYA